MQQDALDTNTKRSKPALAPVAFARRAIGGALAVWPVPQK